MESFNPTEPPPLNLPKNLPGFSKAMAITDLVMSSMRGLAGLLGIVGMVALMKQGFTQLPMWLVACETGSAILVGCFGIAAGILLLKEKPSAVRLGWVAVGLTIINIIMTLIGLKFQIPANADTPTIVGVLIGGGVTLLIRIGLLVAYSIGLKKATVWFDEEASGG